MHSLNFIEVILVEKNEEKNFAGKNGRDTRIGLKIVPNESRD